VDDNWIALKWGISHEKELDNEIQVMLISRLCRKTQYLTCQVYTDINWDIEMLQGKTEEQLAHRTRC
jgi:hypothetical protein